MIGRHHPQQLSLLVSACELAAAPHNSAFSSTLIACHLTWTIHFLKSISADAVFPSRRMISALSALILSGLGTWAFAATFPDTMESGFETLVSEHLVPAESAEETSGDPIIGDLSAKLRYPDYLARDERVFESLSGGIEAPVGTLVVLQGSSLVPDALGGAIRLSSGQTSELLLLQDGRLTGSFIVDDIEWFALSVYGAGGTVNGPRRSVTVEPDQSPSIRLLSPTAELEVEGTGEVAIEFEANDDHGIGRVDLIISGTPDLEIHRTIAHGAADLTHLRSGYRWPAGSLQLDDVSDVELSLRVYDDDTIRGPKFSTSESVRVQVMTPENRRRDLLERQTKILDGLVDLLGERLEHPIPAGRDGDDAARERFIRVRGLTEDLLNMLARLTSRLPGHDPGTSGLLDTYDRIRQDIASQLLFESRHNEMPLAPFRRRTDADKVTVRLLERAISQVDGIILDQQFSGLTSGGELLGLQQEELQRLLQIYEKGRSETSRRGILAVIEKMERAAGRLANLVAKVRGQVPDARVAAAGSDAVSLQEEFRRLRELLTADRVDEAMALSSSLSRTLRELMTSPESGHLAFRTERFGEQDAFMQNLLERISAIEIDQRELRRNTIGLSRQYKERLLALMKSDIDPLVKSQLPVVRDMRTRLASLQKKRAGKIDAADLQEMVIRMESVLKQGDLDQTLQVAGEIERRLSAAEASEDADHTLRSLRGAAAQIVERINRAFPAPARVFSESDRRRLRNHAGSQRHVAGRTTKLRAWIDEQENRMQFISGRAMGELADAADDMRKGASALEEQNLEEAIRRQTVALDALSALQQHLRSGTRPVLFESRPSDGSRRVEIPTVEDYEVPGEFREDILEAMKAGAPEHYKDAIKRYYETLVR